MKNEWWKDNKHWQTSTILSSDTQQRIATLWIIFIASLGLSGYMLYDKKNTLIEHYHAADYSNMTSLAVLVIPLFIFFYAAKKTKDRTMFGETPLTMNPFPAYVGNTFSGRVDISKNTKGKKFTAELMLYNHKNNAKMSDEDRKKPDVISKLLWKMPITLRQQQGSKGLQFQLEARLPDEAPSSESPQNKEYHSWELLIFSEDKSFKRTWEIPIINAQT